MTRGETMGVAVERLRKAFCLVETPEEAAALLSDLCSPGEVADFAQRLEMATMLWTGASYAEVCSTTGASSTTVSRVSKCLKSDAGGYRMVLERLSKE